jgi:glutathione S-transferase
MTALMLHHYEMSPFSEKVRAMLGYANLPWHSVITREMPPRPHLSTLVGGYRKIPVAQIGADLFCDSRIIAEEIAYLAHLPELVLANCSREIQEFVARVDLSLFFACITTANSPALRQRVRSSLSWLDIARFFADRIKMGLTAQTKAPGPVQAKAMVAEHVAALEAQLSDDFLFGSRPCHADFSAYHSLWFLRDLAEKNWFSEYPKLNAWLDRIKALGHGQRTENTIDYALQCARQAEPRPLTSAQLTDSLIGKSVSIAPLDYGHTPTQGTLAGSTPTRWILARETPATGKLHVHFPKSGYQLELVTNSTRG